MYVAGSPPCSTTNYPYVFMYVVCRRNCALRMRIIAWEGFINNNRPVGRSLVWSMRVMCSHKQACAHERSSDLGGITPRRACKEPRATKTWPQAAATAAERRQDIYIYDCFFLLHRLTNMVGKMSLFICRELSREWGVTTQTVYSAVYNYSYGKILARYLIHHWNDGELFLISYIVCQFCAL